VVTVEATVLKVSWSIILNLYWLLYLQTGDEQLDALYTCRNLLLLLPTEVETSSPPTASAFELAVTSPLPLKIRHKASGRYTTSSDGSHSTVEWAPKERWGSLIQQWSTGSRRNLRTWTYTTKLQHHDHCHLSIYIHTRISTGWSRCGVVGLYFYIYLQFAKPSELVGDRNNVTLEMLRSRDLCSEVPLQL
jgi:hypothetical protein